MSGNNGTGDSTRSNAVRNGAQAADRGPQGRFCVGNRAAAGRSPGRRALALRTALLDAITPAKVKKIAKALMERAEQGDVAAAKVVLAYSVGRPAEAVDPDELAAQEYERLRFVDRSLVLRVLSGALDKPKMLEVLALLAGYGSAEELSALLLAPSTAASEDKAQ